MFIEIIVGLVVVAVGAGVYVFRKSIVKNAAPFTDLNRDGKTDVKDVAVLFEKTVSGLTSVADFNNDGKVNIEDAKAAAKTVKTKVTKTVKKVKSAVPSKTPVKSEVAPVQKPKRARTATGKLAADDKSTPDVNEAWEGGVAPPKAPKKKTTKTKKPVMTVLK